MLLQVRGPGLVGAGFLGQRHLPVSQLQIFEQHPPRHPVHGQVMDHQQQALAAIVEADQQGTQQRPVGQIETALRFIAQGGHGFG
ncbi:hypothetical protein D3C72_1406440 [compost metagenome]